MLTKMERDQIRHIIQSPQWQTIERVAELYVQKLKEQSTTRSTQWETLKATLIEDGQIMGIRNFFQELHRESQI